MLKLKTAIYKITIVNLILGFTFSFGAKLSWSLSVEDVSYSLKIKMNFPIEVRLQQVKTDFKNFYLLSDVSGPIQGGRIYLDKTFSKNSYTQELNLKSYGVPGKLISHCKEQNLAARWERRCDLDTQLAAGKMSMLNKFDEVKCSRNLDENIIECNLTIEGTARDLKLFGVTLMSARKLIIKGKYEALKNFSKIWNFRVNGGVDIAHSLGIYKTRNMDKGFNELFEQGNAQLESNSEKFSFKRKGFLSI